ncbi:phage tail protein [Streptomyces sp. UC4497]
MSDPGTFPYAAHKFLVEFDNQVMASFSECNGLTAETEFDEVQEGGRNDTHFKLPKGSKHGNVTLRRGLTDSDVLWTWHRQVLAGRIRRRTVSVILWNETVDDQSWVWELLDAYPVRWTGPDLKADGASVAVETLELAHHGIRKG